jgi:hypothetical protein
MEVNFVPHTKHFMVFMLLLFRDEIIIVFWLVKYKEKRKLGRLRFRWKDNVRIILNKLNEKLWTALFWLMIGTNDEIL